MTQHKLKQSHLVSRLLIEKLLVDRHLDDKLKEELTALLTIHIVKNISAKCLSNK
jgi:hypothetical protein